MQNIMGEQERTACVCQKGYYGHSFTCRRRTTCHAFQASSIESLRRASIKETKRRGGLDCNWNTTVFKRVLFVFILHWPLWMESPPHPRRLTTEEPYECVRSRRRVVLGIITVDLHPAFCNSCCWPSMGGINPPEQAGQTAAKTSSCTKRCAAWVPQATALSNGVRFTCSSARGHRVIFLTCWLAEHRA